MNFCESCAEPGLRCGSAGGQGRAVAEDTQLLGAQRPQSPDRSAACPHPETCQDNSSVTTLLLRMQGEILGARGWHSHSHMSTIEMGGQVPGRRSGKGDAESLLGSFWGLLSAHGSVDFYSKLFAKTYI